ncbi:DUF5818 domain-containing protein [Sphingobium sp. AP50]|uniref:DUF5818 domain-containing protein n=1 Tax=Sphingobium sp. AP50 TaxID=1884369 RepID=UPI000B8179FF|nr:DUF5818 domain-containing protein [Sphingobium sp. AP50]
MPRGSRHDLTGILIDNGFYPILRVADGGDWRLDVSDCFRQLLGHRVRGLGTRSGFDMLDVDRIERA